MLADPHFAATEAIIRLAHLESSRGIFLRTRLRRPSLFTTVT
jgi:hypothetical protein